MSLPYRSPGTEFSFAYRKLGRDSRPRYSCMKARGPVTTAKVSAATRPGLVAPGPSAPWVRARAARRNRGVCVADDDLHAAIQLTPTRVAVARDRVRLTVA